MNLTAIENAIHAEIVTASGLAGDRVIYENQGGDVLGSRDLITINATQDGFSSPAPATPSQTTRDNPTPSAGAELLIGTKREVEFTWRLTFYAGAVSGSSSAHARLVDVVTRLGLDEVTLRLEQANIALFDVAAPGVRSVPVVLETEYESRAIVDLRFRTIDEIETAATNIETVEFTTDYD